MRIPTTIFQCILYILMSLFWGNPLFAQTTDSIADLKPSIKIETKNFDQSKIDSYHEKDAFQYTSKARYNESIWSKIKRWLRDKFMRLLGKDASMFNKIFSWAMIIGLVIALAYFISNTSSNSIFRPNTKRSKFKAEILDEEIDITNIGRAILKAEEKADYRLAIRYRYIQTLLKSEEKEYITLAKFKTIEDYIDEFSNEIHTKEFKKVSRIFEHYWYGDYELEEQNYSLQKLNFQHFLSQLDQIKNVLAKK